MRLIEGSQEAVRAKWPLIRVRSEDEGLPFGGSRVGESSFRRQRGLCRWPQQCSHPLPRLGRLVIPKTRQDGGRKNRP